MRNIKAVIYLLVLIISNTVTAQEIIEYELNCDSLKVFRKKVFIAKEFCGDGNVNFCRDLAGTPYRLSPVFIEYNEQEGLYKSYENGGR